MSLIKPAELVATSFASSVDADRFNHFLAEVCRVTLKFDKLLER